MEDTIEELRQRHPRWAHLNDEQLLIADELHRVVRKEFKLDDVDNENAGRAVEEQAVAL